MPITYYQLHSLYRNCKLFGYVVAGKIPTWKEVIKARRQSRLMAHVRNGIGSIVILGDNACHMRVEDVNEKGELR